MANTITLLPTKRKEDLEKENLIGLLTAALSPGQQINCFGNYNISVVDEKGRIIIELWREESAKDLVDATNLKALINIGAREFVSALEASLKENEVDPERAITFRWTEHKKFTLYWQILQEHFSAFSYDEGGGFLIPGHVWNPPSIFQKILQEFKKLRTHKPRFYTIKEFEKMHGPEWRSIIHWNSEGQMDYLCGTEITPHQAELLKENGSIGIHKWIVWEQNVKW
jgi:hypothetical protein